MKIERAITPLLERERSGEIDVLDVGGAGEARIKLPRMRRLVIDINPDSLARCDDAAECLLGDAQTFDYGARRFDVVIFWNVLEHIPDPMAALTRAMATVRPGGVVVIAGPLIRSLKALITRRTPHQWHVLFYRKVLGRDDAGANGSAPFPVEHAPETEPERLAAVLRSAGFSLHQEYHYVGDQVRKLRRYSPFLYRGYELTRQLVAAMTLDRWASRETEFVQIFRRVQENPSC